MSPEVRPAFLFSGQGSQYEGMAEELFRTEPVFRDTVEECDQILAGQLSPGILEVMYGPRETRALVYGNRHGNSIFMVLQYALTRLWMSRGITPAYVAGHSLGEYAAACVAGVFSIEDGLKLVTKLGKLLHALPATGGMLAVAATETCVADALGSTYPDLSIAGVNAPRSVVVAGRRAELERLKDEFEDRGVRTSMLKVERAYHSPTMLSLVDDLQEATQPVRFRPPRIPLVSCTTGTLAHEELLDGRYWVRLLARPVRFVESMRCLFAQNPAAFVEIGPASTLLRLGRQCAGDGETNAVRWVPSIVPGTPDRETLAAGLAALTEPQRGARRPPAETQSFGDPKIVALVRACAARVARIPEERIDPGEPLDQYGMDSLMAADFSGTIEFETDVRLPISMVADGLTVETAAAYVEASLAPSRDDAGRGDDAVLVPFQKGSAETPDGARLPLYFVPAGDGDLFAVRRVVGLLGPDQPAWGLRPPRARDVPGLRARTIQWLASVYADEVQKLHPGGPCVLAGYSAGGVVAVELARELKRRGEAVRKLVILDSPAHLPGWVDALHRGLRGLCNLLRLPAFARRTDKRWLKRVLHAVMDEGLLTHVVIAAKHSVAPYDGRIVYFRAPRSWIRWLELTLIGKSWHRIAARGIEVHRVSGTHYGMLRGRHMEALSAKLGDCLMSAATGAKPR